MSNKANYSKQYTLADIEQYLQGKLSPAEMHTLEKAALQDAFLADAIEGYQLADMADIHNDITDINNQLSSGSAKVIPVTGKLNRWWQVAAAVIILAGAGMVATKLFTSKDKQELVQQAQRNQTKKDTLQSIAAVGDKKDKRVSKLTTELFANTNQQHITVQKEIAAEGIAVHDSIGGQTLTSISSEPSITREKNIFGDTVLAARALAKRVTIGGNIAGKSTGIAAQNNSGKTGIDLLASLDAGNRNSNLTKTFTPRGPAVPVTLTNTKHRNDTLFISAALAAQVATQNVKSGYPSITNIGNPMPFSIAAANTQNVYNTSTADSKKRQTNILFADDSIKTSSLLDNKVANVYTPKPLLNKDANTLSEVVVVGYQPAFKRDLTNAATSNNTNKETKPFVETIDPTANPVGGWKDFTNLLS
ncbi:MAG: hypothetical protein ABIS69_01430, partial [Sediminibacterium sp.]